MDKLDLLEKRVAEIEKRNRKVETDKAWETSLMRKLLLIFFTYATIALYMKFVLDTDPWFNAIIPSLGFYLSTLSLPFFRRVWEKKIHNK